eukprot:3583961-Pleurochrysis_carterae.AAC.1
MHSGTEVRQNEVMTVAQECGKVSGWGNPLHLKARNQVFWETQVRCTATAVALRVAARQRGACFEA